MEKDGLIIHTQSEVLTTIKLINMYILYTASVFLPGVHGFSSFHHFNLLNSMFT